MSIIDISNVIKYYDSNVRVLNNISISINRGEFFALLGKNGAGKSTTIGILTSLIKKSSGKVNVCGYDLDRDSVKIRPLIGFVSQEYNFNQFETVLDIVLNQAGFYGINRYFALKRAKFYLILFDLWSKRHVVSMSLSGGMKRRLMIVKALIHNPEILILDEPTAGVDVLSRRLIWNFLKELNQSGKTIILTTHYLEEVEYLCNSVAVIDSGIILLKTMVNSLLSKVNSRIILLEVEDASLLDKLDIGKFNLLKKSNNLIEVVLLKNQSLNMLFGLLIEKGFIIHDVRGKYNRLEGLFLDLVA